MEYNEDALPYQTGWIFDYYPESDWTPPNSPKCECGADKTYGEGTTFHSDWCPKYVKPGVR